MTSRIRVLWAQALRSRVHVEDRGRVGIRPNWLASLKNGVNSNIYLWVLTNDIMWPCKRERKRVQKVDLHCLTSFMYVPFAKCYGLVTLTKVSSFRGWEETILCKLTVAN